VGALRVLGKTVLATIAALLSCAGVLGLALVYAPNGPYVIPARDGLAAFLQRVLPLVSANLLPGHVIGWLTSAPWRFLMAPVGLVTLGLTLLPGVGGGRAAAEDSGRGDRGEKAGPSRADLRDQKKVRAEASRVAKKGKPAEAAELCIAVGLLDDAARYFLQAELPERAAEVRHDQNRFLESAELYAKAGRADSAGAIYAQQEKWDLAAEAYVVAGNLSVAAEMYEKAGNDRRAAQCYRKCDFPRYAAKAFIRCEEWLLAAECLEQVLLDEGRGAAGDAQKHAEHMKLVRMTGNLFERGGRLDRALAVLAKNGAHVAAAEVAEKSGQRERAAELFLEGRDAERAAAAFEAVGQDERAARILADLNRDRGNPEEAAVQFERAGEWMEAGDLYRSVERFDKAAECYERFGDTALAAEMFALAGDRERAAENYERAGRYSEAAELFALAGDSAREADLLDKAGESLRAGRLHFEAGRTDDAISALQKVGADHAEFAAAAALLGQIFRDREQYPLAIAKLREAVGQREIERKSVDAFFCLATVHEANGDWAEAVDLYEKVLAFDYGHEDTAERLERARAQLAAKVAASTAAPTPAAGSATSGRYVIRGTLGRGGMGIVYKADDTVLDRTVALKVLPESLKENPQALKNFLREAKSAAQLNHPNIVTVYDAGEQDGVYYIAMEYVDGNTLKDIIKRRGKIAPRGIVHVVSQMCEALAFAHEKKIVHRDVKTANTMWTRDRKAKIMDFGLAKVIEEVRNHTTVVSGTPYYMSPEQTLGKNVDQRSDLYSLGVSVFEMATGTLPFTEGNLPYHHVHTPPPRPQDVEPELPDVLAGVIERCLRKDPEERYQSAREILAELRAASPL
jgi:eukaryotic-like serine/threonine-protein kinase